MNKLDGNFVYDISNVNLKEVTSKRDVLSLLKNHDLDSFTFSFNTAAINLAIAVEYGIKDQKKLRLIFEAGMFHDTGKLGMSPEFLNHPGSYTTTMFSEMKKHPSGGGYILKEIKAETEIVDSANYHHCNFDGSGYPGGLYGTEIPLTARITRISDSYDAFMSKRCYKEGGPVKEAFDDLNQFRGTHYDPELLECLKKVHKRVLEKCYAFGEERPSQEMYMSFLKELYLSKFPVKKAEEVLEIF